MPSNKKVGSPILPKRIDDPAGVDSLERAAIKELKQKLKNVLNIYKAAVARIPAAPIAVNAKYEYRLDAALLSAILNGAAGEVNAEILAGGENKLWFFEQYVLNAYEKGTAQEMANLANQSAIYKAEKVDLNTIIRSEPYRRRIALIRARNFEEMNNLAGSVKADMSRILTDGIARGENPLQIGRELTDQLPIDEKRANRIARSEITTALRRARMDESDDAAENLGLLMKQMQISALSPTTRKSHAERHGKLYTTEELRNWWSENGNSINCKCSSVSVMVDKSGKPLVPTILERARKTYDNMAEKGYPWSEG